MESQRRRRPGAADRAQEYRQDRIRWVGYAASTWGLSAIDYLTGPRMGISERTPKRVTLTVHELTRFSVAWRSLLVPGAGQEFADQHARGVLWMTSVLASSAAALVADHDVRHKQNLLSQSMEALAVADPAEKPALTRDVDQRSDHVRKAKDYRRAFVRAAVGFYAANMLDALVLPLSRRPAAPKKVSAVTRIGPSVSELGLRVRF